MTDHPPNPISADLLARFPTREAKIARIREIEKRLEKMESEDQQNDPVLIEGHIRLTRGYRIGCGVVILCLALMSWRIMVEGRAYGKYLMILFGVAGAVMILRGLIYRPDPQMIQAAYQPHRGTAEYRDLLTELDQLARALSQDLQAEDSR